MKYFGKLILEGIIIVILAGILLFLLLEFVLPWIMAMEIGGC